MDTPTVKVVHAKHQDYTKKYTINEEEAKSIMGSSFQLAPESIFDSFYIDNLEEMRKFMQKPIQIISNTEYSTIVKDPRRTKNNCDTVRLSSLWVNDKSSMTKIYNLCECEYGEIPFPISNAHLIVEFDSAIEFNFYELSMKAYRQTLVLIYFLRKSLARLDVDKCTSEDLSLVYRLFIILDNYETYLYFYLSQNFYSTLMFVKEDLQRLWKKTSPDTFDIYRMARNSRSTESDKQYTIFSRLRSKLV